MNVQRLDFPTPVLVIDDFLTKEDAQKILQECWNLAPHYQESSVFHDGKHQTVNKIRKNDVVYIDQHYGNNRTFSDIITLMERKIFRDEDTQELWKDGHTMLNTIRYCTLNETVLSRYGNCDFYGWHTDNGVDVPCRRMVTIVYYVNTEPEKFEGGGLMIRDGEQEQIIRPKHNRAVVFPSYLLHRVENVKMLSEDVKDFRYSLNCWMGFRQ